MGSLPVLVGIVVAVIAMVMLAGKFGFSAEPTAPDAAEIEALLEGLPGGFTCLLQASCLDSANLVALDERGRVALIAPHGAHHFVQMVDASSQILVEGKVFTIEHKGRRFRFDAGENTGQWRNALCFVGDSA